MEYKIPQIIHYTFKNNNLPKEIINVIEQNKRMCPNCEFRFYNDLACDAFIKDNFGDTVIDIKEFVGSKESGSDIIHLFEMFDYDNYILCNSTYHYWSALLTTYANAIVTYPMDCEWYKHIASNKWIGIQ